MFKISCCQTGGKGEGKGIGRFWRVGRRKGSFTILLKNPPFVLRESGPTESNGDQMTEVGSQRSEVTHQRKADMKPMKKKIILLALCSLLLAPCSSAQAQQPTKVPRIGFLDASTASGSAVLLDAFRQELSKLGWLDGKNITIEYRFAEQKFERLPELAVSWFVLR
jgi:hypothetical protein